MPYCYLSARCPQTSELWYFHSFTSHHSCLLPLPISSPHQSHIDKPGWGHCLPFSYFSLLLCSENVWTHIQTTSFLRVYLCLCFNLLARLFFSVFRTEINLLSHWSPFKSSFQRVTNLHWIIYGHNHVSSRPCRHYDDKVFGYKGLLRFEDAVAHVSRDFASFKSFGLILTEETLFSCCVFCYRGRFSLILSLTLITL